MPQTDPGCALVEPTCTEADVHVPAASAAEVAHDAEGAEAAHPPASERGAGQEPGASPWRRLSKQEKKRLRQEAQVQKKRDWRERAKEKRHAAVIMRRAERIARLAAMSEAERAAAEAAEKAERDRLYQEKVAQSKRIDEAYERGLRVALDLSYSEHMNPKEHKSLSRQVARCWGLNRRAALPISLHLTGLARCPRACLPVDEATGSEVVSKWKVHRLDEDVSAAFQHDELVFLSPDADEPLLALDPSKVYVIGGLVDTSVIKRASYGKASGLGARAVRLPLAEHAPVAHARLPLTLTSVLDILLTVHAGGTWGDAVKHAVAPRLLRPPTYEHSRAARRASTRALFNAKWDSGLGGGAATGGALHVGESEGDAGGQEMENGEEGAWDEDEDEDEDELEEDDEDEEEQL